MLAPGKPGIEPRWTSSAKRGVGTSSSPDSRIWFSVSHGIVNEVYYPRLDRANTRDLGLLITGPGPFFAEEKRDCGHEVAWTAQGVPAFILTSRCLQDRFVIRKTVFTDPRRNALLQEIEFNPLTGSFDEFGLFLLLAPHIANAGVGNSGWAGSYKGVPMLFAQRDGTSMALAAAPGFAQTSCGYVGYSDGWQQLKEHFELQDRYERADDGNIALTGKLDLLTNDGRAYVALAFGRDPDEAGLIARESLLCGSEKALRGYVNGWLSWHQSLANMDQPDELYRASAAILRIHQDKGIPGAWIASLSIPWGFNKGDNDLGGYHLVWVRDLVETATGMVAAGDCRSAREALVYLAATQEHEGRWPQNMWLNGAPYWGGAQLDEVAFPILLADLLRRNNELNGINPWPMIRSAAGFLVRNGPVTQQDRWEEDGGYSPFTLAVTIAGMLAAADFAEGQQERNLARYLRDTADVWNNLIEQWTYVEGTDLARQCGVSGYYVRIAPPESGQEDGEIGRLPRGDIRVRNISGAGVFAADHIISPDCLALVRFGLRSASEPRILNTVRVIDCLLKSETTSGPAWHRYNHDGYGEREDGSPFDGIGIGRAWPLLTGERAHYELAAGNLERARALREAMARQAGPGGLLPEQIWDAPDIPERELLNGRPSGSAMPLVWAHAEYIKLVRSLREGRVFDMPPQPVARYQAGCNHPSRRVWRFESPIGQASWGTTIRIECFAPAMIRWTSDHWQTVTDTPTADTSIGIHFADLLLQQPGNLEFTFYWPSVDRWEGRNLVIGGEPLSPPAAVATKDKVVIEE